MKKKSKCILNAFKIYDSNDKKNSSVSFDFQFQKIRPYTMIRFRYLSNKGLKNKKIEKIKFLFRKSGILEN